MEAASAAGQVVEGSRKEPGRNQQFARTVGKGRTGRSHYSSTAH